MEFKEGAPPGGDTTVVGCTKVRQKVRDGHLGEFCAIGLLGFQHRGVDLAGLSEVARRKWIRPALADLGAPEGGRWSFDREDDVEHRDVLWRLGQPISTFRTWRRCDDPGAGKRLQMLEEVARRYAVEFSQCCRRQDAVFGQPRQECRAVNGLLDAFAQFHGASPNRGYKISTINFDVNPGSRRPLKIRNMTENRAPAAGACHSQEARTLIDARTCCTCPGISPPQGGNLIIDGSINNWYVVRMARPREFDRDAALEKALRVFWAKGFAATSTDDLRVAMGIGRQSLYGAFGDKRTLYLEALDTYQQRTNIGHVMRLSGPTSPIKGIEDLLSGLVSEDDCERALGCMGVGSVGEFGVTDPDLNSRRNSASAALGRRILERVLEGQRSGEINPVLDAEETTAFIQMTMTGLQVAARGGAKALDLKAMARFATQRLKP